VIQRESDHGRAEITQRISYLLKMAVIRRSITARPFFIQPGPDWPWLSPVVRCLHENKLRG